jgi:hypothetical protein
VLCHNYLTSYIPRYIRYTEVDASERSVLCTYWTVCTQGIKEVGVDPFKVGRPLLPPRSEKGWRPEAVPDHSISAKTLRFVQFYISLQSLTLLSIYFPGKRKYPQGQILDRCSAISQRYKVYKEFVIR